MGPAPIKAEPSKLRTALVFRPSSARIARQIEGPRLLSLVHFDLPYYIVGFVVLVDATLREREKLNPAVAPPVSSLAYPRTI